MEGGGEAGGARLEAAELARPVVAGLTAAVGEAAKRSTGAVVAGVGRGDTIFYYLYSYLLPF